MHTSLAKEGCIDALIFPESGFQLPVLQSNISITPSRNEGIFSSYTKEGGKMETIKIGIPTNEKVKPVVMQLLDSSPINGKFKIVLPKSRSFFTKEFTRNADLEFVFARMSEIARLVKSGHLHCGFVTKDNWVETSIAWRPLAHPDYRGMYEAAAPPVVIKEFPTLCRCHIDFISQAYWSAPDPKSTKVFGLGEGGIENILIGFMAQMRRGPRIATRFPHFSEKYLKVQKGLTESFLRTQLEKYGRLAYDYLFQTVDGGEELYVLLGAADFAIVQVETGETLRANLLWIVEHMLKSHLLLVGVDTPAVEAFAALLG